jgi:hypothetical protein
VGHHAMTPQRVDNAQGPQLPSAQPDTTAVERSQDNWIPRAERETSSAGIALRLCAATVTYSP